VILMARLRRRRRRRAVRMFRFVALDVRVLGFVMLSGPAPRRR